MIFTEVIIVKLDEVLYMNESFVYLERFNFYLLNLSKKYDTLTTHKSDHTKSAMDGSGF